MSIGLALIVISTIVGGKRAKTSLGAKRSRETLAQSLAWSLLIRRRKSHKNIHEHPRLSQIDQWPYLRLIVRTLSRPMIHSGKLNLNPDWRSIHSSSSETK